MANTTIGPKITIDGEVSGREPLVVQGVVKGKIVLEDTVHVEPGGMVEADVSGRDVVISGTVTGSVAAEARVEVKQGGKMLGNVKAPRILIADGASFKGSVDMDVRER